jgi:uncharacterized protein (TIGR00156 family)
MKKSHIFFASFIVFFIGITGTVFAQYNGPGSGVDKTKSQGPITTVNDVIKRGQDDQIVILTGNVVRKVGREKYLFRDATGEIRIEIDHDVMPNEPFDEKVKVEITGEVEKDFLKSTEVDVKSIRLLK